jgi:hypothetical protein
VLEKEFLLKHLSKYKVLSHIWTMFLVVFGWVIFTQETLSGLWEYIKALFGGYGILGTGATSAVTLLQNADVNTIFLIALFAAVLFSTPVAKRMDKRKCRLYFSRTGGQEVATGNAFYDVLLFIVLFLCTIQLALGAYNPFIYFRF